MDGGSYYQVKKKVEEMKLETKPLKVLVLSREGTSFFRLEESDKPGETKLVPELQYPNFPTATLVKFAPHSGAQAAIVDELGIHFVDMTTAKEKLQIVKSGVSAIDYSPKDTYLITCERYQQGEKNLVLWNSASGKEEGAFEWRKSSKEGPKSIKFTKDEKYCARLASKKSITVYENGNFSEPKFKITAGPAKPPSKQ
jgi:uncharacterized protein with WD repeat